MTFKLINVMAIGILIGITQGVFAQYKSCPPMTNYDSDLKYGITVGYNPASYIFGLESTILSEPYFTGYTLDNKTVHKGFQGGVFVNKKFANSAFATYNEMSYSQQYDSLKFRNDQQFFYSMQFNYQYINLTSLLRFYPALVNDQSDNVFVKGLYIAAGPQLGFNVASTNIVYNSWGPGKQDAFGSNIEQQQQLRNVLKGKTDFGFTGEFGFIIPQWRADLSCRWHRGLTDLVETLPNSYNFIENKNANEVLQVVLKIDLAPFPNH